MQPGYDSWTLDFNQQGDHKYPGPEVLMLGTPSTLYTQAQEQQHTFNTGSDMLGIAWPSGGGLEPTASAFILNFNLPWPPSMPGMELQEFNDWGDQEGSLQAEPQARPSGTANDTQPQSIPAAHVGLFQYTSNSDLETKEPMAHRSRGRPKKIKEYDGLQCRQCSKTFKGVWYRERHEKYVHMMNMANSELAELTCPWCLILFSRKDVLHQHLEQCIEKIGPETTEEGEGGEEAASLN